MQARREGAGLLRVTGAHRCDRRFARFTGLLGRSCAGGSMRPERFQYSRDHRHDTARKADVVAGVLRLLPLDNVNSHLRRAWDRDVTLHASATGVCSGRPRQGEARESGRRQRARTRSAHHDRKHKPRRTPCRISGRLRPIHSPHCGICVRNPNWRTACCWRGASVQGNTKRWVL